MRALLLYGLMLLYVCGLPDVQAYPGQRKWEFVIAAYSGTGPFNFFTTAAAIGADGTVYVGVRNWIPPFTKLFAFDGASGSEKWEFVISKDSGSTLPTSPAVGADGTVYFVIADGRLCALDGATGQPKWQFASGTQAYSAPAIGCDGTVYFGSMNNSVYAINGLTGQKRWEFKLGGATQSAPTIGADGTVYVGCWDKKLYALEGATGQKRWEFTAEASYQSSPAHASDGMLLYAGANENRVYAIDPATGNGKWDFPIDGLVNTSPVIGPDGVVYIQTLAGAVFAYDGTTGLKKWGFQPAQASFAVAACPAIGAAGTVYAGCAGGLYALDAATGQRRWVFTGTPAYPLTMTVCNSPAFGADGTIYFGSTDGKVYAVEGNSTNGLAQSGWPKFSRNSRNTGQAPVAPRIGSSVGSGVMQEGEAAELSLLVGGEPTPTFRWILNGQAIPGATNIIYKIASVATNDAGVYSVLVSNVLGAVTSGPVPWLVSNIRATNVFGLLLPVLEGRQLSIEAADSVFGPWSPFLRSTLPANPYGAIDTVVSSTHQRFYRTAQTNHLQAWLFPGCNLTGTVGSHQKLEYADQQTGFSNWTYLATVMLTNSPQLFIDGTATNRFPRYYRTTPLP